MSIQWAVTKGNNGSPVDSLNVMTECRHSLGGLSRSVVEVHKLQVPKHIGQGLQVIQSAQESLICKNVSYESHKLIKGGQLLMGQVKCKESKMLACSTAGVMQRSKADRIACLSLHRCKSCKDCAYDV